MSPLSAEKGVARVEGFERVHDRATRAERFGLGDPRDRRIAATGLDERVEGLLQVRAREHDLMHAVPARWSST
jgi:hypothetical protein